MGAGEKDEMRCVSWLYVEATTLRRRKPRCWTIAKAMWRLSADYFLV
jgi:hypothetical protein